MKTISWVLLLLFATAGYSAESFRPPLFTYDPTASLEDDEEQKGIKFPVRLIDFERAVIHKKRKNWVDSFPVVIWGNGLKKGLYIIKLGRANLSFASTEKHSQAVRYNLRF
ncbi:MAG: hypothetical protein Q8L64_04500 [bacterium]|nr:hypothetical protein [bacterium]